MSGGAAVRYVTDEYGESGQIEHLDGVAWHDAPIPWRWHRCWIQTRGWVKLIRIYRCACGAISDNQTGKPIWDERNNRRKK